MLRGLICCAVLILILSCGGQNNSLNKSCSNVSVVKVEGLRVVDLSESGSPFRNLGPPFSKLLQNNDSCSLVETGHIGRGKLVVELSNFCRPEQCFIGARTTMSRRQESGLFHRYERVYHAPVEGLKFEPSLQKLVPQTHRSLSLWLQGLDALPETLISWLKSPDSELRRAGLQAVVDRDLKTLSKHLTPLILDKNPENQELAIALACIHRLPAHVDALAEVARSHTTTNAWSALTCLNIYPWEQVKDVFDGLSKKAKLNRIMTEAQAIMTKRKKSESEDSDKGSSAAPNSGTKDP